MNSLKFAVPLWWRLCLLLSFLFGVHHQLMSQNQGVGTDYVQKIPFSTTLLQWSFDTDSTGPPHDKYLSVRDTSRGNDGIFKGQGVGGSSAFMVTQRSSDPDVELTLPTLDTRGLIDPYFSMHLAAPSGMFEHGDFIGVRISTDGGKHFYPQIKVRGSKNLTSAPGWDFGDGIHYSKAFRYAVNSTTLFGHVDPVSKDTVDGLSRLTITDLPAVEALVIRVELVNSTENFEIYAVDNLTVGATPVYPPSSGVLASDTLYTFRTGGSFAAPSQSTGMIVALEDTDTLHLQGSMMLQGPLYILGGDLDAPGLELDLNFDAQIYGEGLISAPKLHQVVVDTGYHFLGQPAFYPALDTLMYCWVYNAQTGGWDVPQNFYSTADSGLGMARVVYLRPQDVPLILSGRSLPDTGEVALFWADTVLDGQTPLGGWNLISRPGYSAWNWPQMIEQGMLPDSMDATYYRWQAEKQQYGSFSAYTGGADMGADIPAHEAIWVRLSNRQSPGFLPKIQLGSALGALKSGGIMKSGGVPDTTWFEFHVQNGVQHCMLLVDSSYSSNFLPCCDQLYLGGPGAPHVALIKPGNISLNVGAFVSSSYYALDIAGEGTLRSHGAPGWYWIAPNLHPGHKDLDLRGKGPHKILWIADNNPDFVHDDEDARSVEIEEYLRQASENEGGILWDVLGRPGTGGENVQLKRMNGEWIKVITLP